VDHPRGAHDDVANAAAGALTLVTGIGAKQKRQLVVRMGGETSGMRTIAGPGAPEDRQTRQQARHATMVDLIAATKAQAEKEAQADWLLTRMMEGSYTGEMLGELLGGGDDLAARIGEPSPTLERGAG
jgi:hypothetical protein